MRKYSYAYDDLNRLNDAYYQRPEGTIEPTNAYNESLDYDRNGNITRLSRTGNYDGNDQTFLIDLLEYHYKGKSNFLLKVSDSTNESLGFNDDGDGTSDPENDYKYDDNGNMISDENKAIDHIAYNHLNLPTQIDFVNGSQIFYFYNASGVKLKKEVHHGFPTNDITITDYLGGFQYENTVLQFFPHAEGYVKHTPDKYGNPTFDYVYNYTDHLGNIRLSYTLDPLTQVLKILEENHYYPFGLKHTNYNSDRRNFTKETETDPKKVIPVLDMSYKYKYNGKEWQDELGLNFYDYGARNYDPAIGRWMNMDNMSEKYYEFSPYNYVLNNPVNVIDPDGNDIIFILFRSSDGVGGHAGIAVSNYKKDENGEYIKDKKGNYIQDGTYTYYSYAPGDDESVSDKNYKENVRGKVSIKENVTMDDIMDSAPNVSENNKEVIGVVQFNTNKSYDEKVKKDFEDSSKGENKVYNLINNNCTTFTSRAFSNKKIGIENLTIDGKKLSLYTENKMFRDLSKAKDAKVLLNPGKRVNETDQQRYDKYVKSLSWYKKIKI